MPYDFSFPVKRMAEALAVTEPNTEIDVFEKQIYVDLDDVRGDDVINSIKTQLGFNAEDVYEGTYNFVKLLFRAHRGSGKSTELRRIRRELEESYLVVPISIEKDIVKISSMELEDFYQVFTLKIVEVLLEKKIVFDYKSFENIANIWLKDTSFIEEYKVKEAIQGGGEVTVKVNLWVALFKTYLKGSIFAENHETKRVRQKIKMNINEIITKFNMALAKLKCTLRDYGYSDILYIVDGTEKINYDLSKKIFVDDAALLNQINSHFIFSSPIYGLYDINRGGDFLTPLTLSMIKITDSSISKLAEVVYKRVDSNTFFDAGIVEKMVRKSGGCIRQLLQIVHNSLIASRGKKITQQFFDNSIYEMGRSLYDRLNSEHRAALIKGYQNNNNFTHGDIVVKEMLFDSTLFACSGIMIVNPLLEPFLKKEQVN